MQTPAMLAPDGSVRHIILSEIGISNAQGSEIQAAALCASYAAVMDNPFIDEMMYLWRTAIREWMHHLMVFHKISTMRWMAGMRLCIWTGQNLT